MEMLLRFARYLKIQLLNEWMQNETQTSLARQRFHWKLILISLITWATFFNVQLNECFNLSTVQENRLLS